MLNSSSPDFSRKPLKMKEDDKFFCRLISRENSAANPSFRVYYGNVSGSVPFTWEIQPGTPKHKFFDNSVPPLTPPPCYFFSSIDHGQNKPTNRKQYPIRSKFLYKLLLNIKLIKKGHVASSSTSFLSSSSSMSSTVHSSRGYRSRRRRFMSFGSSLDEGNMYSGGSYSNSKSIDDGSGDSSYSVLIMKKAFLSIVGRRSG